MADEPADPTIDRLARLFREHPAWVDAARRIAPRAKCNVYFTHRAGEVWRLEQAPDGAHLRRGAADDPDFVFRFAPGSIDRLAAAGDEVGEFAVALFALMLEDDPQLRVDLRIAASFPRLVGRGYLRLLIDAGPAVLAFGASHGIQTVGALRRFVARLRRREPADWETGGDVRGPV